MSQVTRATDERSGNVTKCPSKPLVIHKKSHKHTVDAHFKRLRNKERECQARNVCILTEDVIVSEFTYVKQAYSKPTKNTYKYYMQHTTCRLLRPIIHIGGFFPNAEGTCGHLTECIPERMAALHATTRSATVLAGGTGIFRMICTSFVVGVRLLKNSDGF